MKNDGRYEVVKYCDDYGFDEGADFSRKEDAIKECRLLRKYEGVEAAAVYDRHKRLATVIYGDCFRFIAGCFTPDMGIKVKTRYGLYDAT